MPVNPHLPAADGTRSWKGTLLSSTSIVKRSARTGIGLGSDSSSTVVILKSTVVVDLLGQRPRLDCKDERLSGWHGSWLRGGKKSRL